MLRGSAMATTQLNHRAKPLGLGTTTQVPAPSSPTLLFPDLTNRAGYESPLQTWSSLIIHLTSSQMCLHKQAAYVMFYYKGH